jgi:hypothetical protein
VAKRWPLKFPLGQASPRDPLAISTAQIHSVRQDLETETGGEI